MRAFEWLGKDDYDCFISCTKEETIDILSILQTKVFRRFDIIDDRAKYYCFLLNTKDKIITPIKSCTWISHPERWDHNVGKKRSIALVIDQYSFQDSRQPDDNRTNQNHADHKELSMKAFEWLGKDDYDCYILCTEEETEDIISIFGNRAKGAPELYGHGIRCYCFVLNTKDKIISPIKNSSWLSHPDWGDPLVGKERTFAVFLDRYSFHDCMYP